MSRNGDEDSGRSSCSAASVTLSPVMDYHFKSNSQASHKSSKLVVSTQPRSNLSLLKSPDERDPFPSCRLTNRQRKPVINFFDTPRMGGLSNAHSTLNIACSTQLESSNMQCNAVSMNALHKEKNKQMLSNFRRTKPVQRAASRLYKADVHKGKEGCIGPEFIVRASQPAKSVDITTSALCEKRVVSVVLLNGQKIEVLCDPNTVTAGQIFEGLVHSEKYEHHFMLGVAFLLGGDFVFLPDDYKIKKIAPENWHKAYNKKQKHIEEVNLTVFLRIKFFLPKNIASNIQGGEWRYRVYLQLRRATVEGQMISTLQNLILLAGYALHIEFGEFTYREHGSADYFLLEHYLPESLITNDMADIKLHMKKAHESRRGLEKNRAVINYITLAQTFRDYGAHFYSAIWATRDGFCRDVWLSIGPRGITLYSRNNQADASTFNTNRIVLQSLPWHHIHNFYHNKKSLYIIPNSYSGLSKIGIKYKLKMTENKSFFIFWLASLHHRLYLKLYAKEDFLSYLTSELGCPFTNRSPSKVEVSNYQDSYNLAVRNPVRIRRPVRRRFKVDIFGEKKNPNKENQIPKTEELLRQILSPQQSEDSFIQSPTGNSSNDGLSSSESSLPRRHGVKMGTRVFNGMQSKSSPLKSPQYMKSEGDLTATHSDSDDLSSEQKQHCYVNSMELLPERPYSQNMQAPTAYVIESPKVYSNAFNYNDDESCMNTSIFEKLDNMECVQSERVFVTAKLERDQANALGLQVAEGADGNVYIKSITPGSSADSCNKLLPGDQIISVNGQTLLNLKYDKSLSMLQTAPKNVELIVLQNTNKTLTDYPNQSKAKEMNLRKSIASIDADLTDDELLNEEALKTIYALIKLTKDKVVNRMKDKSSSQTTPVKTNLQKCYSENRIYEEADLADFTLHKAPEKGKKFNTWRGNLLEKHTRRPMSLSIPPDELPDDYLDNEEVFKKSSLKSIQSSLNNDGSGKIVPLPRNFGVSRKWIGPVRYPVTPCKNNTGVIPNDVVRRHFVYGAGDSDEDQIFL